MINSDDNPFILNSLSDKLDLAMERLHSQTIQTRLWSLWEAIHNDIDNDIEASRSALYD